MISFKYVSLISSAIEFDTDVIKMYGVLADEGTTLYTGTLAELIVMLPLSASKTCLRIK